MQNLKVILVQCHRVEYQIGDLTKKLQNEKHLQKERAQKAKLDANMI